MADLTTDLLTKARKIPQEFHQLPELVTDYVAMNYLVKPFDNIHIRQAFALAVNRDDITHNIWLDSRLPTYHIIPSGMLGYNPNLTGPVGVTDTRGNPYLAKQLLEQGLHEEGWSSIAQFPVIKLTYSNPLNDSGVLNEVTTVVQMWQTVFGIKVQLDLVSFDTFLNEENATINNSHGLHLWWEGWIADYPDPQDWTTLQFGYNSPFNTVNYGQNTSTDFRKQLQVQQQLEAADVNQDQATRLQAYNNAEQQLVNDVAWLPIDQRTEIFMLKPYVQGLVFNAMDLVPPDDWANVYIAPH